MAEGPSRVNKSVNDLHNNTVALDEFSRCLDPQFKNINNWEHFASDLGVPPDVIRTCKLLQSGHSPTTRLFEYLDVTRPDMTIGELRDVLTRNQRRQRHDINGMLKGFQGQDKVSQVITKSTSGILDKIALKLDSATKPTCNWIDFGLELGLARDKLSQFETTNYSPTEALFRYLYATSRQSVKLSVIVKFLQQMERNDVLKEVRKVTESKDTTTIDAKNVFKLGSELLQTTSKMLNKESPALEGWRGLASRLVADLCIDDPEIINKLEPCRQHEIHSPTRKVIEWLAANKPETKIGDVAEVCRNISHNEAEQVLAKYFSGASEGSFKKASASSPPPFGIHKTSETGNILEGNRHRFGLPERPKEFIVRCKERDDLVSDLSSGQQKLVVLHSPTGYGKTSLVLSVADKLINNHEYTCIYVDTKGISSPDDLVGTILKTCGHPYSSRAKENVIELFKNFYIKNNGQKCFLILDHFDHMFRAKRNNRIDSYTSTDTASSFSAMSVDCSEVFSSHAASVPASNPAVRSSSFPGTSTKISDTTFKGNEYLSSMQVSTSRDEYLKFLIEMIESTPNLQILATTWETFTTMRVRAKQVELRPLPVEESRKLLLHECKSVLEIEESCILNDYVDRLIKCCCGIPLILCSAVVAIRNSRSFDDGVNQIVLCPLEELSTILSTDDLPLEEQFNHNLRTCFNRLDPNSKIVLIVVSAFPGAFSEKVAWRISEGGNISKRRKLDEGLKELKRFNFLSYRIEHESYSMSPAIRSFVICTATESDWQLKAYREAQSKFVDYTFKTISDIEIGFLSVNSQKSIKKYRGQEESLREIVRWCVSDSSSIDLHYKKIIIEFFTKCHWINMKLMRTHSLKKIMCKLAQFCERSKEDRKKENIEYLIYGGVTFMLSCLCVPQLCVLAQEQAKWCFEKALVAMADGSQNGLDPLKIVLNCNNISKEAQTEFLLKYGKFLVRQGEKSNGFKFISAGIRIREKDPNFPRKGVMVAEAYSDLADAYSYCNMHKKAVKKMESKVLPVYIGHLESQKASALSNVSHYYIELEHYEKAIKSCEDALEYRKAVFDMHPETARSQFDLGHILTKQATKSDLPDIQKKELYEKALGCLKEALEMYRHLLDSPKETAQTHQEIVSVLKQLGRNHEARQHAEEMSNYMKKVDKSHSLISSCTEVSAHRKLTTGIDGDQVLDFEESTAVMDSNPVYESWIAFKFK